IVVTGFGAEQVAAMIGPEAEYVVQGEQLGTGHAVLAAQEALTGFEGTVMVLCGDTPLLTSGLLTKLYSLHKEKGAQASVLTSVLADPAGYGRVITTPEGYVAKIVEQKDAAPAELLVNEINTGLYCFEKDALLPALLQLKPNNAQGEYYLTDVIAILNNAGVKVQAVQAADAAETMGVNSRVQLAAAEKVLRKRKLISLMEGGVTILDPDSTFIDSDVVIGSDTVIYPFTMIEGAAKIGARCKIGPHTRLENALVGDDVVIHFSYGHDCRVERGATVGPYVHLRPDAHLSTGVKIGNFVEIKNSFVGTESKVPHLSYIGDSDLGAKVNIGSGTITVNYDGRKKHRTVVEDEAFIGCNTNLVAPVTVGKGAYVAAGSTITKDVPPQSLGVARSKQKNIEGWAK
ncbi:MAG: bifunctional UDP-N-acetylglucosamine diphosphorylase/glucosamine-1-phosphate N-acetyltransferase GlmU, partial [Sporomusaceae bacterium]|nr:bifunctional UDP-N-acetylglucosamine diphosphorylase/glucosamine-1-phosphate N-acetyltransferase GlmU [Sporomusaceae bacterium]